MANLQASKFAMHWHGLRSKLTPRKCTTHIADDTMSHLAVVVAEDTVVTGVACRLVKVCGAGGALALVPAYEHVRMPSAGVVFVARGVVDDLVARRLRTLDLRQHSTVPTQIIRATVRISAGDEQGERIGDTPSVRGPYAYKAGGRFVRSAWPTVAIQVSNSTGWRRSTVATQVKRSTGWGRSMVDGHVSGYR